MPRWIGSLLVALLVAAPLMAGNKDADRARQFEELRQSSETDRVAKVLKLIETDPKDDLAFKMLVWALQATRAQESQVFDLLAAHHLENPAIVALCRGLSAVPAPKAAKFLRQVLADSPEKSAQGCACYALAQLADREAAGSDPSKAAEAARLHQRVLDEFADVKSGRPGQTLGDLSRAEMKLLIGKTAPEIASENLAGDKVQLKDYRGKVVVLDIWATWCGPCRAMIPHERDMVEKLKDKPFALVSISFDEDKSTLRQFLERESMPWTHWWNGPEGGIAKEWNIRHFPTIYVLDAKGVIRYKELRGEKLEEAVEKLLAEMK